MIPRNQRLTLFPYTTLFRSVGVHVVRHRPAVDHEVDGVIGLGRYVRSEEHTSELQSQSNLVCRLLLEKKKLTVKLSKYNVDDVALGVCKTGAEVAGVAEVRTRLSELNF